MFVASSRVRIPGKRQAIIFVCRVPGLRGGGGGGGRGRGLGGFQINPCSVKTY